ncbi:MAG: hypothetical protein ABIZ49_07735 [Opitutaceae bacterium]
MENKGKDPRSLEERLAACPEVLEQLREMADELAGDHGTLDEVEDKMVARVRQLGRELLSGCARQMAAQAPVPAGTKVRRHVKKKSAG